jgi:hypothetical protein
VEGDDGNERDDRGSNCTVLYAWGLEKYELDLVYSRNELLYSGGIVDCLFMQCPLDGSAA